MEPAGRYQSELDMPRDQKEIPRQNKSALLTVVVFRLTALWLTAAAQQHSSAAEHTHISLGFSVGHLPRALHTHRKKRPGSSI